MTERKDMESRVLALLASHARNGVEPTLATEIVADTSMDSVAVMDFVLDLEDEFDVTIPLDRLADVVTVADLLDAVATIRAQAAGATATNKEEQEAKR